MAFIKVIAILMLASFGSVLGQRKLGRNIPVGADVKKSLNFDCPEEFGYYPHPADCTQYYVCVFGGALLESCTGGLMYSHELQTCDWPRNVGCDPTIEVTTPTVTYQSSSPNRSPEPKLRYTHPPPPPVPPQPAAVVTSRGQPRQLHHTQQEIVKQKQQQQLYVDAEEALPPAEEIESDRQQRVYRGQPSTIGQVQRDRDGLRQHTNAIPLSSGRGEKIGVISFGTQQSLPEYREKTDDDDFDTNSLTKNNHYRFKRQIGQSYGTDSRQYIMAQSYSNGQRSPLPTFQTTFLKAPHGSPYRADITNNKPALNFLSIATPTNNEQRLGLFRNSHTNGDYLLSNAYDQNYQYFNLNHGSLRHDPYNGEHPFSIDSNKQVLTKFTDGFVPSMHFSLAEKKYKDVHDVDAYLKSSTTFNNGVFQKLQTTELAPVSKRPDSIFKQYLTVSSDKPKINNTFNILSFLNYFRPSHYDTSTISIINKNTTKPTKPTTKTSTTSVKTLHSVYNLKKTNSDTTSSYVDDYSRKDSTLSPSRGVEKFPERNTSFYDEYYDYLNDTDYYYDDLNLLNFNYSSNLKVVTTTTASSVTVTRTKSPTTVSKLYSIRRKYKSTPTTTTSFLASVTTRKPSSPVRPTSNSGHRLSTTRRIEKGNRPIEQTISTATPKTIYNNTNQYDSSRYDSYYALYDDDVDLYKDIEYAQHYHTEPPSPSPAPKQTYRGTPAPVTHQVIAQEKPSKLSNSAYIQNTYSTADDIYEPADIQRYNDNNYNSQDDHQPVYHQSKQTNRGDRNELNYIEEPATTKRITTTTTTTTVTTPRQYPTQKNVRIPSRYSNTANQNEVRVQPTHYTLPEDQESKTIPHIQNPTLLYVNVPDVPVLKPIVSQPSPFRFSEHSTTPKTPFFHYITKTSKSTSVVSTTPNPVSTAYIPVNKQSSKSNITNQKIIMPTTYSPPYFIRKSLLRIRTNLEGHDNSWKQVNKSVAPQLNVSESNENKAPLKLQIHPATINNELWSSTNIAIGDIEEEQGDESVTDSSSTIQYSRVNVASSTTESFKQFHLHSSTTTTMTAEPIQLVTDFNEISTSETFALDNDINNTSWLLLLERLNSISHDNKTTSPEMEHDSNQSNFSLTEKQISVTFNPIEDVTKKTFSRTTPIPTRASRVNAAIKSVITFGGPQRQYSKCSDNKTSTAKCGKINQRVTTTNNNNNRGRGSAHYTSSGRNNENNLVNRGTPASRSRPTLKPSTSVIAKAAEFVDIYKYPPRRPDSIYPQPLPDKTAAKCRKDVCLLPDCSCGGKEIPGDLPVEQVPQMVLLTYDDSVNDLNKGLYHDLFEKGRVNPNGCPIAATFYVSHEWTDYSQVQNLYSDGHELASHTVSHSFGEQFSQKKWTKEVAGQREILSAYGGVHLEDVRGMRAPFLSVGGNKMFKMLYDSNFTYDSSMPIYENKPPSWPYTLDYKLFHDCMIPPCPTRSYPGVWEVPMVMWQDLNGGRCSMGDACSNPSDAEGVYKMIMKNFERHYTSNRAPFGLFYHAAWFTQPHHKEGFIQFLDAINSMKDVWLVTNWQAIQWVRDPTPVSRLNSFQPFGCNYPDRPKRCNNPKVCNLWHKTGVRYMRTCQPCPDIYPWTGNTGIHSSRIDNDLEE